MAAVERLFGQRIEQPARAVLILKTSGDQSPTESNEGYDDIPEWFNVLEGLSDEDLADFLAILNEPLRLAHSPA